MAKTRAKVLIKGVVQGVNFRYYTRREAIRHNVAGWVSNLPDGSVAAIFEGEEEEVEAMVQWCRQGPPSAQVAELIVQPEDYRAEFQSFSIRF
jgi:acylphosphatase